MATCTVDNCDLEAFEGMEKCVLHSDKGSYSSDRHKISYLSQFYTELVNYIVNDLFSYHRQTENYTREEITAFLAKDHSGEQHAMAVLIKSETIDFSNIYFPHRDSRDYFDYKKILIKLGGVHFIDCEFEEYGLELINIKCFYQNCIFYKTWYIYDSDILESANNVIYQDCQFRAGASIFSDSEEKYIIKHSLFNDCEFIDKIQFTNVTFESDIFNNTNEKKLKINEINILNCEINNKFILNNCSIVILLAENSVFNAKVEIKNNDIYEFSLINTNFFKLVDSYNTKYRKFLIEKCIFEDFVGFEKCEFGNKKNNSKEFTAVFLYATFISFVNLRNTKFICGLDIEHINLKEAPNFLNTEIEPQYTNRETYRIVKNSFDIIGNHIAANKFFVQEMRKYKKELKGSNLWQEKFIFFINEKASNFGQSYLRPVLWLVCFSVIYGLIIYGYNQNTLYEICPPANDYISYVTTKLNYVAKSALPFKSILQEGMELISILFYIIMASLVWLTIVAIKRHTKR